MTNAAASLQQQAAISRQAAESSNQSAPAMPAAAMMASMCSAAGAEATLAGIDRCRAAGMDELYLVPTSSDPDHLSELIDLIT